ncbi:MAG: hypothetical protein H6923_00240 [Alphaproteobacteria bacterium]|nr:hypothetical protein [Alphaproteobacteria bacterium]
MQTSQLVLAFGVAAVGLFGFWRALGARGSSRHYWLIGVGAYALLAAVAPFAGLFPDVMRPVAFELQKLAFILGSMGLMLAAIYALSGAFAEQRGTVALGGAALAFLLSLYGGRIFLPVAVIFHAVAAIGLLGLGLIRLESHPRTAPYVATGGGLLMALSGLPTLLTRALGGGEMEIRFVLLGALILVFAEASHRATR